MDLLFYIIETHFFLYVILLYTINGFNNQFVYRKLEIIKVIKYINYLLLQVCDKIELIKYDIFQQVPEILEAPKTPKSDPVQKRATQNSKKQ